MSFQPLHRSILVSALTLAAMLGGCGQKGPLYIPETPAAAQRATLPQTVFGGSRPAQAASSPTQAPPLALPNLPEIG